MNKRLLAVCAACAILPSCAPQMRQTLPPNSGQSPVGRLWADFSAEGIVWSDGQQACVARTPQMQPVCPRLPAPTGPVAWDLEGRAWAALPRQGLVTTLDGPPRSQVVGRAVALTANAVYREDGSALGYGGEPRAGVVGRPSAAITGGDGNDYALVGGQLVQVGHPTAPAARQAITAAKKGAGSHLYPTTQAASLASVPTAVVGPNAYALHRSGNDLTLWKNGSPAAPLPLAGESKKGTLRAIGNINQTLWGLVATPRGKLVPQRLEP